MTQGEMFSDLALEQQYDNMVKELGMKQETIEEAIERLYGTFEDCKGDEVKTAIRVGRIDGFYDATKWQTERMYSEEEVIELLQKALTHKDDGEIGSLVTAQGKIRLANFFSWFNKFKKK